MPYKYVKDWFNTNYPAYYDWSVKDDSGIDSAANQVEPVEKATA